MSALLELHGVCAGYDGGGDVLHDVDLSVDRGEVLALLGANGAGKSTTLRTIAGILRPRRGQVRLLGRRIGGRAPSELARCGLYLLPEGRAVFPTLSVADNLRLATAAPERTTTARIDAALDAFPRLAERRNQAAGTMSGGEQRMLALARAFVADPLLLLLDEPSLGLAPIVIDDVFSAIARFRAEGAAVVLVEQYVHRALEVADRVTVMAKGAVSFAGDPRAVSADDLAERYLGGAA